MPTDYLQIPVESDMRGVLSVLANKNHTSIPNMAKELLIRGIEDLEDETLGRLALERKRKNKEPLVSHEDAWK